MKHFSIFLLLVAICCGIYASSDRIDPARKRVGVDYWEHFENLEGRFDELIKEVNETITEINTSQQVFRGKMRELRNETELAITVLEELLPRLDGGDVNSVCGLADHQYFTNLPKFLNRTKLCIGYDEMLLLGPLELSKNILNEKMMYLVSAKEVCNDCKDLETIRKKRHNCYIKGSRQIDQSADRIRYTKSLVETQLSPMIDPIQNQRKCPFYEEGEDLQISSEQFKNRSKEIKQRVQRCQAKIEKYEEEMENDNI